MTTAWVPSPIQRLASRVGGSSAIIWLSAAEIWSRQREPTLQRMEERHSPGQRRVLKALILVMELLPILVMVVRLVLFGLVFNHQDSTSGR